MTFATVPHMSRTTLPILGILVLSLLSACGSTQRRLDLPRDQVAELRGIPAEFQLLGTKPLLVFTSLDGVPFDKGWNESNPDLLDLMPGKHRVGVYYTIQIDGQRGPSGEVELEIDAQAGHVYQAELVETDFQGWLVEFRDVTPEKPVVKVKPKDKSP